MSSNIFIVVEIPSNGQCIIVMNNFSKDWWNDKSKQIFLKLLEGVLSRSESYRGTTYITSFCLGTLYKGPATNFKVDKKGLFSYMELSELRALLQRYYSTVVILTEWLLWHCIALWCWTEWKSLCWSYIWRMVMERAPVGANNCTGD